MRRSDHADLSLLARHNIEAAIVSLEGTTGVYQLYAYTYNNGRDLGPGQRESPLHILGPCAQR